MIPIAIKPCAKRKAPKYKVSIDHEQEMIRQLRADREFAVEYFRTALEEIEEPKAFSIAFRQLVIAIGVSKIARATGIRCAVLNRRLARDSDPRVSMLRALANALGQVLTVKVV
jgi:DNA-binding phage protein